MSGCIDRWFRILLLVLLCLPAASAGFAATILDSSEFDGAVGSYWTATDNGTSYPWTNDSNTTPSSNVGPSGPLSGSGYLYTEASSPSAGDEWYLTSSNIDADAWDATLNFWYNKYHNTYTTCNLQVQVSTDGGSSWGAPLWTTNIDQGVGGTSGTTWLNQSVDLSSYSGTIKVRFKASSGGYWQCDSALDKVVVSADPACVSATGPPIIDSSVKVSGNPIVVCDVYDTAGSTLTNISIDNGGPNLYDGASCTDINTTGWGDTGGSFLDYNIAVTAEDNCGSAQVTGSTFKYNSCVPTTGPISVQAGGVLSGTTTDITDVISANGATLTNIKVYKVLGIGADIDEWENFDIGGLEGWGANWTATGADGITPQASPSDNGDLATGLFTRSENTGPSEPYDGDFIYYEASFGAATDRYLVHSTVYDAGNNDLKVTFKYLLNGADVGTLELQVKNPNYNSGAWTSEWSDGGNKGDRWKTGTVDLKAGGGVSATAYVSGNTEIRFRFTYGGGTLGDIALDAIHITGPRAVDPAALFDGSEAAAQNADTAGWPEAEIRVDVTGTDDCGGDLSDVDFVTFRFDGTAPTMTSFQLPTDSLSPVSIYSMFATDNYGVTGYLVTETPGTPADSDPGWTTEPPTFVTTANVGSVTFYGWAKDAARNISASLNQVVNVAADINAPTVTGFVLPTAAFSPLTVNQFTATDDSGQVTGYMITESATPPAHGDSGWLTAPPAQFSTASTGSTTFYAWAKDSVNVSTALTQVVDVKVDTEKPVVTFDLPTTHDSFIVPITTFLAGDTTGGSSNNTGVAAYLVTTNSTPPNVNDSGWSSFPPATLSVTAEGLHSFWGWAKDNADNVSVAVTDSVTVTLPASCNFEVDMGGTLVQTENYTSMGAPNPWAWDTILTPLADSSVQSALNDGNGDLSSGGYLVTATGGTGSTPNGSRADYPLFFTTSGTYCIWIRGLDESGNGGGDSNFWGVDGSYVGAMTQSVDNQWAWTNGTQNGAKCTYISGEAVEEYPVGSGTWGEWHTINLWPREEGQKNDMFMLTNSTSSTGGGKFSGNNDQVTVVPSGVVTIDPTCVDQAGGGAPGSGAGATGYITIDDGQSIIGSPIDVEALYTTDLTNPLEYRALGAESDGFEHFAVDPKWSYSNVGNDALDPDAVERVEGQGVFKLTGSGAGIWSNNDYFSYNYLSAGSGDFSIDVQVRKLVDRATGTTTNQSTSAKAGIMVRQSLATNSRNLMMQVTSGTGAYLQSRTSDGGTTTYINGSNAVTAGVDTWLRLTRSGSSFEGFYSTDNGSSWTSTGTTTETMSGTLFIGLGVSSQNTARDSVATFDNFLFMPQGPSSMSESWTPTDTALDASLPTAWVEQDYAIAVRDPAVAGGSAYQVNNISYNPCIDATPSTLTIQTGQIVGSTVSLNSLFDYTGNPTGFQYEINGNAVLNPWNSYSVVPAGIAADVTFKVSAADLDCGGSTLSASGIIHVDNISPDPTPSTITILTGQVTGGPHVDLTAMFTSTGNVATGGFTVKINGTVVGNPSDWDSRQYGNAVIEKVTLEVRGVDPDSGNTIVGLNDISVDNTCVRNAPSVSFDIVEGHVGEGRALPYTVTIRNEDSFNCGPSSFDIDVVSETNLTDFDPAYFNPVGSNLNLLLGGRESVNIELAIPAKASAIEWNSNVTTLEITSSFGGVHNTPKTSGTVTTKVFLVSPITHNSVTTGSGKWSGKWGTSQAGAKYGNFDCLLCHEKGGANIKWITGEINLNGATWGTGSSTADLPIRFRDANEGPASPANDAESNDWGDDDPDGNDAGEAAFPLGVSGGAGRTSSNRPCEVCHTQTMYHRYDTSGQTELAHFNGRDCTACHRHSSGFSAGCQGCHGNPPLEATVGGPNGLAEIPGVTGSTTPGTHYKHVKVLGFSCEYCHDGWRNVGEMPKEVGGLYQINHKFNVFSDLGITDPVQADGYYTGQDGVNYEPVPAEITAGRQNADGTIPSGQGTLTCENIYCHGGTASMSGTNPQWNGTVTCDACHGTSAGNTPPGYSHTTHVGKWSLACTECHAVPAGQQPGYNGHVNGRVRIDLSGLPDKGGTPTYNGVNGTYVSATVYESNTDGSDLPPSATYGSCSNIACHYGTETPVWNSGNPATCTTCHNDGSESRTDFQDPTLNASYNALTTAAEKEAWLLWRAAPTSGNHDEHVRPSAVDNGVHERMIGTYLNKCESCHGGGANKGQHAGHVDFATSIGGMTYDGSTCTSVCHDARYITWGSASPLSCEACHMAPYLGPTVVDPDNEGTGLPTSGYGSHLKINNSQILDANTDWAAQCSQCHPFHDGGVLIPQPPASWDQLGDGTDMAYRLGLQFPVSLGIHLGGSATSGATEAEICWDCHDQNSDNVLNEADGDYSEFGVNSNLMTGSLPYDYGSLSNNSATSGGWYSVVTPGSEVGATWTSAVAEFSYKSGAIQSTHSASPDGTSVVSGSSYAKTETLDAVANIRCTYCHDVHDLNRAVVNAATGANEVLTGQPYLRGSWRGNPYKEDGAPRAGMSGWTLQPLSGIDDYADVPRASASESNRLGGFWIDQNSGDPNGAAANGGVALTLDSTAGLCTMCHGTDVDNLDQTTGEDLWVSNSGTGNGHMNAVIGGSGTTSTAYNIFTNLGRGSSDVSGGDTMPMGGYGFSGRAYSYRGSYGYSPDVGTRNYVYRNFAWAGSSQGISAGTTELVVNDSTTQTQFHTFNCGKCHNPHASRLPKLMITNCLDTRQNDWDDLGPGMDQATSGSILPVWRNTYASQWPAAQNCHRLSDATQGDSARDRGKGWNRVTPW